MHSHYRQLKIGPDPGNDFPRALIACGLWLRAGFVGASAVLVGSMLLFGGKGDSMLAVALVIGGGILVPIAWRRSRSALDRADASVAKPAVAVFPRDNARGLGSPVLR